VSGHVYEEVTLYFNFFKNTIMQAPTAVQLMPFDKESFTSFISDLEIDYTFDSNIGNKDMIIEPDLKSYIVEMKRQIRNYVINAALVQNKTGEHAARMVAMKSAKDNAVDFVKSLTLSFNKARQGAITQEISEIVSAKIAIEG
jgi:F-type H+-transporting ATPase subunit gamma